MRSAIYVRTAIDQNCEMQLRELRGYVERRGWVVTGEYVELGCSGPGNRPQLARLMADSKRPRPLIDCVLVWTLDRWGRSLESGLANILELHKRGIRWIAVGQGIDMGENAPGSAAMLKLITAMMTFGSEMKRERIKAAMAIVKRNAWSTGDAYGRPKRFFDRERLANLRQEGKSIRAIAAELGIGRGTVERTLRCPKRVTS